MKRLVRIIESADPRKGGPIFGVLESTKVLRSRGFVVDIVTLDNPDDEFLKDDSLEGVFALGPNYTKLSYTNKLGLWLDANLYKYDFATIHGVWQWNSFGSFNKLLKNKIPYIIFPHGSFDVWDQNFRKLSWFTKKVYYKFFENRVLLNSVNVLFTSEDELINSSSNFDLPLDKCRLINYGVPSLELNSTTLTFDEGKQESYLLFLSRIHKKKGIEKLLEAFSRSIISNKYRIKIAGTGEVSYIDSLKKLIIKLDIFDKVEFVGHVAGAKKIEILSEASLFVLPSYQENFGLAVAESLSLSTPVAISNKVNIWNGVDKHGAGFVYNNTVDDLVDVFDKFFYMQEQDYKQMCLNAKICFDNEFNIEKFVDDLEKIILDLELKS